MLTMFLDDSSCKLSTEADSEDYLLQPDDSLTTMENLINVATFGGMMTSPSNVTTLILPNSTSLDESMAASLPNDPKTVFRVKKMSSIERGSIKKVS